MAKHTSFGLGGPADVYVQPLDEGSLKECAAFLKDAGVAIKILGRGTNLLVRSGGIEGAVLSTEQALSTLRADGGVVTVGSGIPLSGLLSFCAESGLTGLEPLAGIPGSVGGAAIMNAGSYDVWFADHLESVVVFEPGESSVRVAGSELDVSYRRMGIPDGHVVERRIPPLSRHNCRRSSSGSGERSRSECEAPGASSAIFPTRPRGRSSTRRVSSEPASAEPSCPTCTPISY
jgi:UDP-N-acetylmuramate dehydrogenase